MVLVGGPVHTEGRFDVLTALRQRSVTTRQELSDITGIPRKLVSHRIDDLINLGLAYETTSDGGSSVGRPPKMVHFRGSLARTLVIQLGTTSVTVGIADLSGTVLAHRHLEAGRLIGPEEHLQLVDTLCSELTQEPDFNTEFWGIGVGMMGPINPDDNRHNESLSLPVWPSDALKKYLTERYNTPVWLDNEVNTMAVGEHRAGVGKNVENLLYVKIGSGLGIGIIANGDLIRGALGASGEIGHSRIPGADPVECYCGGQSCLVGTASGLGIARQATDHAHANAGPLADVLKRNGHVTAKDVATAATAGDPPSLAILTRAGTILGRALADVAITINPSLIVIGGGVALAGKHYIDAIRESLLEHCSGRAAANLTITTSTKYDYAGLQGAAWMAADRILTQEVIDTIDARKPLERPQRPSVTQ